MALRIHHECNGLLVHDFTNPLARWQRPEHQVLSEGFRLATRSAWHSPQWFTANSKTAAVEMMPHEITFVYNKPPPTITGDRIFPICKEWGSQISDDELITLDDLSEFDTNPTNGAMGQVSCDLSQQNRGRQSNVANEANVIDNRKINADPIHQIIPQPHLFPSPFMNSSPKLKDQTFTKRKPIFLAPYSEFPGIDYARVAWLVPIRGAFPWNETSSGVILDSEMPSLVEGNTIQWNSASLLNFWSFLLELRKAGSLGSLGVSLHSARREVECSTAASSPNLPPHDRVMLLMRSSLSTVDYVKVYNDASASFHVRRALDSWSYHQHGRTEGKLRLLKGATLPLVDEVSSGILLL